MENENQNLNNFPSQKKEGGIGPVIGSIVVILIIILGGLYYFKYLNDNSPKINNDNQAETQDINQIEKDTNVDDTAGVDADMKAIEDEINSALTQ